jgi:putative endonuclease
MEDFMFRYFVYILQCSDKSFYIGVTNNLTERLIQHQEGYNESSYTFSRRPVRLVYHETYSYVEDAIQREKQLKKWSRKKKQALIDGKQELLKELSKSAKK